MSPLAKEERTSPRRAAVSPRSGARSVGGGGGTRPSTTCGPTMRRIWHTLLGEPLETSSWRIHEAPGSSVASSATARTKRRETRRSTRRGSSSSTEKAGVPPTQSRRVKVAPRWRAEA